MAKQFLPIPKKGKVGDTNYLRQTILAEIMSQGWYRGQMDYVQTKLFGLTRVRGKLVYGNRVWRISDYARPKDSSEIGKLVNRFLDLMGFTDKQKEQLYASGRQSGVDRIDFDWQGTVSYSAADLNIIYENILNILSNVEFIKITHRDTSMLVKPMTENAGKYGKEIIVQQKKYYSYEDESGNVFSDFPGYEISSTYSWASSVVELVEYGGTIKTDVDGLVLDCIISLIATSGSNFVDLQSYSQVGTWTYLGWHIETRSDAENGYTNSKITESTIGAVIEDTYKIKSNPTFAEDEFKKYEPVETTRYDSSSESDIVLAEPRGYDAVWSFHRALAFEGVGELGQTFITDYPENGWWLYGDKTYLNRKSKRFLLVDAVRKYNFENTVFYMSKFAHFSVRYKKKKSGFLGIGGIVGEILGGIVNAIVSIISALSGIAYYIPILRLEVQIVMWLFTGDWSNDKEKFKIAFTKIALIVIAILIIIYSGGSATQQAIQFLMAAISGLYSLYSLNDDFKNIDRLREMQQMQDSKQQIEEEKVEDISKIMDSNENESSDAQMFTGMFDDFDNIDNMYSNPFDGQFDISFDVRIK